MNKTSAGLILDLLNLNNFHDQMLSGVSGDFIEFITNESGSRYLHELDQDFFKQKPED